MSRRISDTIFDSSFGYRYIRGLGHFGVRLKPIQRALALDPGDRVLDVGCGTGDYAPMIDRPDVSYLGLDMDEKYVLEARRLYGSPNRKFETGDVRSMALPAKSFTHAVFLGVMHHLNDEDNLEVIRRLNQIVSKRLVIMDLWYGGWHVVNNLLCRLDRGRYPRTIEQQRELVGRVMDVQSATDYFVRSGVQRYSLIVATPR